MVGVWSKPQVPFGLTLRDLLWSCGGQPNLMLCPEV